MEILTFGDDECAEIVLAHVPITFKAVGPAIDQGLVEGYGATFDPDYGGDRIVRGAFDDSLARHQASGTAPAFLLRHDTAKPIGKWIAMGADAKGLRVRGQLNLQSEDGRAAHAQMKAGDSTGLSIGFTVPKGGASPGPGGTRLLHKIDLHEISAVTTPMQHDARVTSVKSITGPRELENFLREGGLSKSIARKIVAGG